MKKNSTVAKNRNEIFKQTKLTVGLDLGDRTSHDCILDEAGNVILEDSLPTTPKGIQQVFVVPRGPNSLLGYFPKLYTGAAPPPMMNVQPPRPQTSCCISICFS
jgi:hypothetical protein